jgi:hypothetical protein
VRRALWGTEHFEVTVSLSNLAGVSWDLVFGIAAFDPVTLGPIVPTRLACATRVEPATRLAQ